MSQLSILFPKQAFASIIVRHGLEKHLLHQSPELFRKIDECRQQLLSSHDANEVNQDDSPEILPSDNMYSDLLAHIKLLNEKECPELHNVDVPKVS